ncbi:MAG TPA: bifunctional UDP-N-acetylglucosamine diphosphorylase/glucosamine-1-phosphate N-acetyltransferase GlmU, partial [Cyanobacteria bacterium UBA8156]|nr:bifunctional UDP-N-acetylglucosamine diphosphorylase/glucosamine-1-phosphate N-acetyltransferase GlmU [Cyanobacteria bacterium UBA8156]
IGPNSQIGPGTYIRDSTVGANTRIVYSHIEQSTVGDDCRVGPYARLRGEAVVGDRCRIGNFVELKHATLGPQTTAAHLSYLGDATIGTGVNIGAGTVTANYDGTHKHPTIVGDRSKTGANSVLVAPVEVGQGANIGAGSVIVENVPDRSLAIARARQVTKPDYYDEGGQKQS